MGNHAPISELETQNRPPRTQLPTSGDGLYPWLNLQLFKTTSQFLISTDVKARDYVFKFSRSLMSRDLKSCSVVLHGGKQLLGSVAVGQGGRSWKET